MTKQIHMFKYC